MTTIHRRLLGLAAAVALAVMAPAEAAAPRAPRLDVRQDTVLAVGWRRPVDRAAANRALLAAGAVPLGGIREIAVDLVTVPAGGNLVALQRRLAASPLVEFAERPPLDWRTRVAKPNDPLRRTQYALDHVRAQKAWSVYPRSFRAKPGPLVAVLDTGLDPFHLDMQGQWVKGARYWTSGCGGTGGLVDQILADPLAFANLADVCSDGRVDDVNGHGTGVASVIAAHTNNGTGMSSIAFNSKILPLSCADKDGHVDVVACSAAVVDAVDRGARVINMSFGGVAPSLTMLRAVEFAYLDGAVLVAARGNSGTPDPAYPACYPHVIGVSATDRAKHRAKFSSYGGGQFCTYVAAPGVEITMARASTSRLGCPPVGSFGYMQCPGTSFSSPEVAAVVALALGRDPSLTPDDVFDRLSRCSQDIGPPGYDDEFGFGLVDAYGMLTCR